MISPASAKSLCSWLPILGLATSPLATAQSLSVSSLGLEGWDIFEPTQIAMLDSGAGKPTLRVPYDHQSSDLFDLGPALTPIALSSRDVAAPDLYFSQDLLVLKPKSAEAKYLAEIIAGDRPWPSDVPEAWRAKIADIYETREFEPLWQADGMWKFGLDAALYQVAQAERDGLRGDDYTLEAAYRYVAARSVEERTAAELILTSVIAPYAHDMLNGRHARKSRWDLNDVFTDQFGSNSLMDFMDGLVPSKIEYLRLRDHLAALRAERSDENLIPLLSDGRFLRLGSQGSRVAELRHILTLTGDYTGPQLDAESDVIFDQPLHEAVVAFQQRSRLGADGIVGRGTRRALNARSASPIALIKVNMERLRWEDRMDDENDVYVRVNLPEYRLHVRDKGVVAMDMRAIIGRTDRRTPIMSDVITNLKFSPDWTVPPTVYSKDILPALQADPSYAARNGYSIIRNGRSVDAASIDWSAAPRVTIRKAASANGPLGGVRFSMSNSIGIFLHDTNKRGYFRRSSRALSSGCVRVGDPAGLAHYLLQGEDDWSLQRVKSAMNRGRISYKNLPNGGVPVYLSYMTAFVDEEGVLRTTRDPYGEDRKLLSHFDSL